MTSFLLKNRGILIIEKQLTYKLHKIRSQNQTPVDNASVQPMSWQWKNFTADVSTHTDRRFDLSFVSSKDLLDVKLCIAKAYIVKNQKSSIIKTNRWPMIITWNYVAAFTDVISEVSMTDYKKGLIRSIVESKQTKFTILATMHLIQFGSMSNNTQALLVKKTERLDIPSGVNTFYAMRQAIEKYRISSANHVKLDQAVRCFVQDHVRLEAGDIQGVLNRFKAIRDNISIVSALPWVIYAATEHAAKYAEKQTPRFPDFKHASIAVITAAYKVGVDPKKFEDTWDLIELHLLSKFNFMLAMRPGNLRDVALFQQTILMFFRSSYVVNAHNYLNLITTPERCEKWEESNMKKSLHETFSEMESPNADASCGCNCQCSTHLGLLIASSAGLLGKYVFSVKRPDHTYLVVSDKFYISTKIPTYKLETTRAVSCYEEYKIHQGTNDTFVDTRTSMLPCLMYLCQNICSIEKAVPKQQERARRLVPVIQPFLELITDLYSWDSFRTICDCANIHAGINWTNQLLKIPIDSTYFPPAEQARILENAYHSLLLHWTSLTSDVKSQVRLVYARAVVPIALKWQLILNCP